MKKIGLTGGIGCGKSTVLRYLAEEGARVADADAMARALTAPGGEAIPAIVQNFGEAFLNPEGGLDRAKMRTLVFEDAAAKAKLERILHPLVRVQMENFLQACAQTKPPPPYVVLDIPLLLESDNWRPQLDCVVLVDCTPETQVTRAMARTGLPRNAIEKIMAAQALPETRRQAADVVIWNEGVSLLELQQQVQRLAQMWAKATQP